MSDPAQDRGQDRDWVEEQQGQSVSDRLAAEALIVDVDGFEGPLDLLLTLSRTL